MGAPLDILRADHTSAELRALSNRCPDGAQVRRILALAMILDGRSRTEAAELNGMDRQTLRDWVHRYNACGIGGLKSRRHPGRAPLLTPLQKAELLDVVVAGPDPELHGVVRWRCVDLQAEVERRFSVKVHVNTIGVWLHDLGLTRLQPRPVHPKKDPEAEATFKKTSSAWSKPPCSGPRPSARWKSGSRTKPASVRKAGTPTSGRRSAPAR
jgi:transposase